MSDTYLFWTHGVSVIPEYTKEYTGHNNGLKLWRRGWGAEVSQNENTDNWFHFAVPSASWLDDEKVKIVAAGVIASVNNSAVIDWIHVRVAPTKGKPTTHKIIDTGNPDKSTSPLWATGVNNSNLSYSCDGEWCFGPVLICVHVRFLANLGKVTFHSAGATFEEWN